MRAITDDPKTARLMGIPVRFIVMLTWPWLASSQHSRAC